MWRTARFPLLALISGIALGVVGSQIAGAQQQPIKRTELLKTDLDEIKGSEMQVWVADIAPGAASTRQRASRFRLTLARIASRFEHHSRRSGRPSEKSIYRQK